MSRCKQGYTRTTEGLVNRFWCKLEQNTHSDLLLGDVLGWDVTSVWALTGTSAATNFTNLDQSQANHKIWSTQSDSDIQTPFALHFISLLSRRNNWDMFFFFFSMSQDKQKHWTIRQAPVLWSHSTRPCSTSCSHINSNNSDVFPSLRETNQMIYTQTAVDQAFCPPCPALLHLLSAADNEKLA